jgi:hypothetical protein
LDAPTILKKAIAAHGGEANLQKYTRATSKGTGTLKVDGKEIPATFEIAYEQPGKLRLTVTADFGFQKVALVQVMNGDKFKSFTNNMPSKMSDTERAELKQAEFMQDISMLYPLLTDRYILTREKDEPVDGKPAYVLSVTRPGAKPVKIYIDQATGYFVKHGRKGFAMKATGLQEVYEEATLSDFKTAEGVVYGQTVVVTQDGQPFIKMSVSELKFLKEIDPKLFQVDD